MRSFLQVNSSFLLVSVYLIVDEDGGNISVRIIGDTGCRDSPENVLHKLLPHRYKLNRRYIDERLIDVNFIQISILVHDKVSCTMNKMSKKKLTYMLKVTVYKFDL